MAQSSRKAQRARCPVAGRVNVYRVRKYSGPGRHIMQVINVVGTLHSAARSWRPDMWKTPAVTALLVSTLSAGAAAQDAKTVIDDATLALGAAGLSSIMYSGSAATGNF